MSNMEFFNIFKTAKNTKSADSAEPGGISGWLKNLASFLAIVAGYGLLLNLVFFGLHLADFFDIFSVAGFGLLYYFVTEEILTYFRPHPPAPKPAREEKSRGERIAEAQAAARSAERESAAEKLKKKLAALRAVEEKRPR